VEAESKDPNSILNAYKRLLALRKTDPALRDGSYEAVNENDPNVFTFLRRSGDETVLVTLNMSGKARTVAFHLAGKGVKGTNLTPLYSSPARSGAVRLDHVELAPFATMVGRVE
jgi:alpha-glucosidase